LQEVQQEFHRPDVDQRAREENGSMPTVQKHQSCAAISAVFREDFQKELTDRSGETHHSGYNAGIDPVKRILFVKGPFVRDQKVSFMVRPNEE